MIGNENHRITLAEAAQLTENYRRAAVGVIAGAISGVKGEAFGKNAIDEMLAQTGCTGTRIYYGLELLPIPRIRLILVGVDSNGNDLVNGIILDYGTPCPTICSTPNALNS